MSDLKNYLKKSGMVDKVRNSYPYKVYARSVGDWRYPLLVISWATASFLTRRRKVKTRGVSFDLPCQNWITHFRWYLFNKKEVEVRDYIDEHVKEDDVFFDIGANIGVVAFYVANKKKQSTIYAFEPEYGNLALLKEGVISNKLSAQIKMYSLGVSDQPGISHLYLQDLTEGAAAHTESRDKIDTTDEGYRVVASQGISCVTLDSFSEDQGVVPNCIKIDTDGNEVKVLTGGKETLKNKALRTIIIETPSSHEKKVACDEILSENGFKLASAPDGGATLNQLWIRL